MIPLLAILDAFAKLTVAITSISGLVVAVLNRKKLGDIHVEINGRLSELMRLGGVEARGQGFEEGRQKEITEGEERRKHNEPRNRK